MRGAGRDVRGRIVPQRAERAHHDQHVDAKAQLLPECHQATLRRCCRIPLLPCTWMVNFISGQGSTEHEAVY